VSANQALFPIATMARVLGVWTAGCYAWRSRPPSARSIADDALLKQVRTIHALSRGTYGAPRVHAELRAEGRAVGTKRIARLMRAAGIVGVNRRRGLVTTQRDRDARPAPDLVDRNFTADRPNQLWVADITYVPTAAGFLYLAVVLDAFSRRIVGWAMQAHLRTELVLAALDMAIGQRKPIGVIHHSDQGKSGGTRVGTAQQSGKRVFLLMARIYAALPSEPVRWSIELGWVDPSDWTGRSTSQIHAATFSLAF
jgi:putative transposase